MNEQNLVILRKKVAEARDAKEKDEKELRDKLHKLRAELDLVKNKTVPEWVSTVDVATGRRHPALPTCPSFGTDSA